MDPERARKLFEQAAAFSVQTSSGLSELYNMTPAQESFVKQSTKRSDSLTLAKKYLKASEAVEDLEKALSSFPGFEVAPPPAPLRNNHAPHFVRGPGGGQIVPYLPVAPARFERAARRQELGLDWFNLNNAMQAITSWKMWKWYWRVLKVLLIVLALAPLFILVAFTFQVAAAVLYLASHPELLIKASFGLARFFPTLASTAIGNMYDQYFLELANMWEALR